ncbi:uncharacterized protein LOC127438736 [Myxocyprinus asiaticus]|uniref:uncharacterized protein LOC127438736 n=1 Tax=Myxocyprinus asiaticus TaxID=70543 RepID=UPI0022219185|nr:uncharacterized protein LOC127438736 [Myxocyprinus asiaticus]
MTSFLCTSAIISFLHCNYMSLGLFKKLDKIARDKNCLLFKRWQQSIKKQVYWTAASSKSGAEKVAKWKSLINHIQDIHAHDDAAYPKCDHPIRVSKDCRKWFQPGSKALFKVEKLLTNKTVLKDVGKVKVAICKIDNKHLKWVLQSKFKILDSCLTRPRLEAHAGCQNEDTQQDFWALSCLHLPKMPHVNKVQMPPGHEH